MKKNLLITLFFLSLYSTVNAINYIFTGNGTDNLWTNSANWDVTGVPPATLMSGDNIIIDGNANLNINYTLASGANFTVNSNRIFRVTNGNTFTNNGTVTINVNGEILNRNIITNNNVIINNGTITNNAGSTINNTGTFTNNSSATVNSASTGTINNPGSIANAGLISYNPNAPFFTGNPITGGGTLPIDLLYFKGLQVGNAIVLKWETASEKENAYMEVQRSKDGINFVPVHQEKGHGTTIIAQKYTWIDLAPLSGQNYYRLKQVDANGKAEFHQIEVVTFNGKTSAEGIRLYPTEVKNELTITWDKALTTEGTLYISDVAGHILQQQKLGIGTAQHQFNATQLPQGHYFISLQDGRTVQTVRFVKL